jgi:predicted nucleic acid-binding protein
VYVPKVVIAELIQGAMREKEIAVIEDFVNAFLVIDQTADILINLRADIRLDHKSE